MKIVFQLRPYNKAWTWVKDVDAKDLLFVALTIETDGLLWTGDKQLRIGLAARGFDAFFLPEEAAG